MRPGIRLDSQPSTFQEIVESLNDMIYELDEQGHFKYANATMENILGYSKDELKALPYWKLVKQDEQQELIRFYRDQRNNCIRDTYNEFTIVTKQGEELTVGQNVRMEFTGNSLTAVRAVARDLSKILELQSQLDEQSKLLSSILNTMGEAVLVTDAEGKLIGSNDAAAQIFKTDTNDLSLARWAQHHGICHTDQTTLVDWQDLPVTRSLKGEHVDHFEAFIKNKDTGEGLYVTINSRPLLSTENDIKGVVLVATDATAKKVAELELRKNEAKFRAMSDASPLGVFVTSKTGHCEYTNEVYSRITGLSAEEAAGDGWTSGLHPDDRPQVLSKWQEVLNSAAITENEQRFVRADGKVVWTSIKVSGMKLHGEVVGYIGTIEDITGRKEYEQELLDAKRLAEEASQVKEEFLSTMSHEIRTPLNAVIGITHLLLEDNPQPYQLENLNTLKFSAENLLALINDVLDYNKLEAGAIQLEEAEVDLRQLLNSIQRSFQPKAILKDVRISVDIDPAIPGVILGDPLRLSQIVNNLISNALKFTSNGSVSIAATLADEKRRDLLIRFTIKDTGIGIPEEKLQAIFERFSQAEKDTSRKYGGTGLGLSITKKLVEMWGGSIDVKSKVGKGSEFIFNLSFKRVKESLETEEKSLDATLNDLTGVHVLIVDDSYINQLVAAKFVTRWGATADKADNGLQAVEMIKAGRYDVVLMDLEMPGMDGIQTTEEIRKAGRSHKKLPVIALTAASVAEAKAAISGSSISDLVQKPFNPDLLYQKIALAVKRQLAPKKSGKQSKSDFVTFAKVEQVANGDRTFIVKLIKTAIGELNKFRDIYLEAFRTKDQKLFQAMKHKIAPSLRLFDVKLLEDEIKKGEMLFYDSTADPTEVKKNLLNVRQLFNTTTDLLQARIEAEENTLKQ